MSDLPPDAMHTTAGVFQALAWARALTDVELVAKVALGKNAHPPSLWALFFAELRRRGLADPLPPGLS
jgi:hypothetical protein